MNNDDWVVHDDIYVKPKTKVALKARETRRKKENPLLDKKVDLYFDFSHCSCNEPIICITGILKKINEEYVVYLDDNDKENYVEHFRLIKIVRRDE